MTPSELERFTDSLRCEGWQFRWDRDYIHVNRRDVKNTYKPDEDRAYGDTIEILTTDTVASATIKVFVRLQWLTDHELREQFQVDGERPFDPHAFDNPALGTIVAEKQKVWFCERQAALDGF